VKSHCAAPANFDLEVNTIALDVLLVAKELWQERVRSVVLMILFHQII
jgi:hypothetical protein